MSKYISLVKEFINECWHSKYNLKCIKEYLSESCLHDKTIGKCIGTKSFITDCYDWSVAFPDYSTKITSIEQHENTVICHIDRKGSHLNYYKSTNSDAKSILSTSQFFKNIENLEPTGASYFQPAKVTFAFYNKKIAQIIIEENSILIIKDLGLNTSKCGVNRNNLSNNDEGNYFVKKINDLLKKELTKREAECLALAFCGFSSKHIGQTLKVSYRTVETHLLKAYQKIGCYGKQDAIEFMFNFDLLILWIELGKLLIKKYYRKKV